MMLLLATLKQKMSASGSSESPELKVKIESSAKNTDYINSRYALYLFSNNKHAATPETVSNERGNSVSKTESKVDEEPSVCLSLLEGNLNAEQETVVRCYLLKTLSAREEIFKAVAVTKGLSLLEGNLNAEQETVVRCYLLKTLSAREDLSYENEGKYAALQFSNENPEFFGCYYHRLSKYSNADKSDSSETDGNSKLHTFFICLIGPANGIMESFCSELGKFCFSLIPLLDPEGLKDKDCMQLQLKLKSWYVHCIEYIGRCIKTFGEDLSLVLLCSLWGNVEVLSEDEEAKWDVEQFVDTCCVMPNNPENTKDDLLALDPMSTPTITIQDQKIILNRPLDNSPYCKKWLEKLQNCGTNDYLGYHNVLEAFRLKTVQDLNVLKRLVQKSQMDHYALYRAFLFLKASGYEDILLYHVKREACVAGEKDVLDVISCLQDFLKEEKSLTERRPTEKPR